MADDFFGFPWWIALIVGTVIGAVFQNFIQGILPSNLKEKSKYWRKDLGKRIHSPKINVRLLVKTSVVSVKVLEMENTIAQLEKEFRSEGIVPARQNDSLILNIPVGKQTVKATIDLSAVDIDNKLIVDQIQCTLEQQCDYRKFSSDVYEMREAQKKIQPILRNNISDFTEDVSLMCELKELYELTGILADANIGALRSSIEGDKLHFDLSKNMLTVYGKEINAEMLSLMKKMIAIYF